MKYDKYCLCMESLEDGMSDKVEQQILCSYYGKKGMLRKIAGMAARTRW